MAIISLQSAASALTALDTAMDVTANNLANVNTAGFKASRANFQDLLYQNRSQPGIRDTNSDQRPIGLQVGLGTKVAGTQLDFTPGTAVSGGPLDLNINGNGFFKVAVPPSVSGTGFAFTRAGQFTLNVDGEIVMANDKGRRLQPVISVGQDVTDITISATGEIFVKRAGQTEPEQVGQLQLANFINPAGLMAAGGNLYVETPASGPPVEGNPGENAFGELEQGKYEGSNVDPTRELIDLIRVQRAFEMNSNTIRAADQALQTVAQLRR